MGSSLGVFIEDSHFSMFLLKFSMLFLVYDVLVLHS